MTPEPNVDQARAWDQGWRAAVAWMRLGATGDLPANPYEPHPQTCSCGCGNPVGDS